MEEVCWVGSNGTEPERVFFAPEDAFTSYCKYIDSFNIMGLPVKAYMLGDDGTYTDDF